MWFMIWFSNVSTIIPYLPQKINIFMRDLHKKIAAMIIAIIAATVLLCYTCVIKSAYVIYQWQ